VVLVAAIYVTIRLAGYIYAGALVRGGARVSWSTALRLRRCGHPPAAQQASE
jgi:hypothetical protein